MKKILCIDGGGVRGLIPALVLAEIEQRTGRSIASLFDLIAGTSAGGIITLGLTVDNGSGAPAHTATDLVDLFEEHGEEIFPQSFLKKVTSAKGLLDELYLHESFEKLLLQYLTDAPLHTALTNVLVPTYDIEDRRPFLFKNWREDRNMVPMWQVGRAASAAPTFFEPALVEMNGKKHALIDGGVFANNPTMCAYAEARRMYYDQDDRYLVVSLGTGELTRPILYNEAKDWGKLEWAVPILGVVFDGVSDVTNYHMHQILNLDSAERQFYRFQTRLDKASDDIDNVKPENIAALKQEARDILDIQTENIDRVCEYLLASP